MRRKKLSPEEIEQKIRELKSKANEYFHKAGSLRKKSLKCALYCGDALIEIKSYIKHGEWQQWVEDNFEGSYETAAVYMGVAEHWGDPRVTEMRKKGITIDTIKGFYNAVRGKPEFIKGDEEELTVTDIVLKRYRKDLIYLFRREVNDLDRYKLIILGNEFYYFWSKLYIELRKLGDEAQRRRKRMIEKNKVQSKKKRRAITHKAIDKVVNKRIYKER